MFNSYTYGSVTLDNIVNIIAEKMKARPDERFDLTIGTDSQVHSKTKIVEVISLHEVGRGGIFFYRVSWDKRLDMRGKIYKETQLSLELAENLALALIEEDLDLNITIHIDIGHKGPTHAMVSEITGWISSMGFGYLIKPESSTASTIADKISK